MIVRILNKLLVNKLLQTIAKSAPPKISHSMLVKANTILVAAIWVVLGALLLYSLSLRLVIGYYAEREDAALELVSSVLGVDVTANTMELGQDVLSPWVRLENVQVRTTAGSVAMTFGLLEFDISFMDSLEAGRLTASQVRVSDADIRLVQAQDGLFGLAGGTGATGIDLRPLVDFFRDAKTAHITSSRIRVESHLPILKQHKVDVSIDFENVLDASYGRFLQAKLTRHSDQSDGESISLAGRYVGELRDLEGLVGRFRLQAVNLRTNNWRTPLAKLGGEWVLATSKLDLLLELNGSKEFAVRINATEAKGSFSRNNNPTASTKNPTASTNNPTASTNNAPASKPLLIHTPKLEIFVQRDEEDWQWQVVSGAGEMADLPLKAFHMAGELKGTDDNSQSILLTLDQSDTEYLRRFMLRTNLLTAIQSKWLDSIKPTASFNNFKLRLDLADNMPPQFAASMHFHQGSIQSFNAIPAVVDISGELLVFEKGGELIFADTPFDFSFPYLFDATFEVNRGSGAVAFTFLPGAFFIKGQDIKIDTQYGFANGNFSVNNAQDPDLRVLSLHFGFNRIGTLDQTLELMPTPLSDGFKTWLAGALQDAQFERGGAIYHDHIQQNSGEPFDLSSIATLWDLSQVHFKYSDDWPAVQTRSVQTHVTESGTDIYLTHGQMFDLALTDIFVQVQNNTPLPDNSTIKATGNIEGKLDQAMAFIQTTPLQDQVGAEVLSWTLDGEANMATVLDVRLDWTQGGKVISDGTNVNLKGNISSASLYAPSIDLTFNDAAGDLIIDSNAGVFAEKISFQAFGASSQASITSNWQSGQDDKISIKLDGMAHNVQLAKWLELPPLNLYQGVFKYRGDANFTLSDEINMELVLTSLLRGLTIPMPKPFGKTANESRPITMLLTTTAGSNTINLKFKTEPETPREIQGLLEIVDGDLDRGIIRIADGKPLTLPAKGSKLHVSGYILSSDLGEWLEYIDAVETAYQHAGETPPGSTLVTAVDVATNVSVGDFMFHKSDVKIRRDDHKAAMDVMVTSQNSRGSFIVFDDESLPIDAKIQELSIITETGDEPLPEGTVKPDMFADVDFADLVPMKVAIDSLSIDNQPYGSWSFDMMPSVDEVVFSKVDANIRGYEVLNEEDSIVVWTRGEAGDRTTYKGRSQGSGLSAILASWDYPATFDANTFKVTADVSWAGSPIMIDWLAISGDIEADLRGGELTTVDKSMASLNKIISILDISSWVRRLYLDFDDLKSDGIAFDRLTGKVNIDLGLVTVTEPLHMQGPGTTLSYTGKIDINSELLDGTIVATLPLAKSLSWGSVAYGALTAQPIAGLTVWLLTRLFKDSFDQISSLNYKVSGSLQDPQIKFDSVFSKSENRQRHRKKAKVNVALDQGV